jgi:iron-sulfur cluster repair protein YtfE (RIC family)
MSHSCSCGGHVQMVRPISRFSADQTVEQVKGAPGALDVLAALGINHCCGAHLSLSEAAAAAGVGVEELLRALNETVKARP